MSGAPYRWVRDTLVEFDAFHGFSDVALDRVFQAVDGKTVHIVTATEHYGTAMERQVESVAELIARSDPEMGGLVLNWPPRGHNEAGFVVVLFEQTHAEAPADHGVMQVVGDDGAVLLEKRPTSGMVCRYADPHWGHCRAAEMSAAMGLPASELALLFPEIHERVDQVPGWWDAVARVDARGDEAASVFRAIEGEWML